MKFNLPDNIQQQVIQYDATAKKQAAIMATIDAQNKPKSKRNVNSCGRPINMIPSDIIKDKDWEDALDYINQTPVSEGKVRLFTKPVFGGQAEVKAFVYFYKQLWVAGWLPRKQDDGYFYGLTWAYKDTKTAYKYCNREFISKPQSIDSYMFHGDDGREDNTKWMPTVKQGRVTWRRKTIVFDQHMINEGYTDKYWGCIDNIEHNMYCGRNHKIYRCIRKFEEQLSKNIPTFKGRYAHHNHMFQRVSTSQNTLKYLMSQWGPRPHWLDHDDEYTHDPDWMLEKIRENWSKEYQVRVWNAPWFRKLLLSYMHQTQATHIEQSKEHIYNLDLICHPYGQLNQIIRSCNYITNKWRTCDLNYLHSRLDLLLHMNFQDNLYEPTDRWIEDNLPIESYLNMMEQKYNKFKSEEDDYYLRSNDNLTGKPLFYESEMHDTFTMLEQCLSHIRVSTKPIELKLKPKRWRLTEWHDQLMSETWKIRNPNEKLPQKLFPDLIEINEMDNPDGTRGTQWKIFQPRDTHDLARWGQAARNCVGNSSYSKGIKQCKHMIILVMVDNQPKYTIQTTFDQGEMTVSQITKVEDGRQQYRLEPEERARVEHTLNHALRIRSQQLAGTGLYAKD
mgnify:CR=1 FL=1